MIESKDEFGDVFTALIIASALEDLGAAVGLSLHSGKDL